jgi:hypothetical protein
MKTLRATMRRLKAPVSAATITALVLSSLPPVWASSHSDAPLIKQDPQANLNVYASLAQMMALRKSSTLVSIVRFPSPVTAIYDRFADDALYRSISRTLTPQRLSATISLRTNPLTARLRINTILLYGWHSAGPISNIMMRSRIIQTYTVKKGALSRAAVCRSRRERRQGQHRSTTTRPAGHLGLRRSWD